VYQVEVDTTDSKESRTHAHALGLDFRVVREVGPGGGWPTVAVRGERDPLLDFLSEHCGSERDGREYFEEFAEEVPA
jgi:hypothetical protein